MIDQQHRRGARIAALDPGDQAAILLMPLRHEDLGAVRPEPGLAQPIEHPARRDGAAAGRGAGIGLHQFAIDIAKGDLVGAQFRRHSRAGCQRDKATKGQQGASHF